MSTWKIKIPKVAFNINGSKEARKIFLRSIKAFKFILRLFSCFSWFHTSYRSPSANLTRIFRHGTLRGKVELCSQILQCSSVTLSYCKFLSVFISGSIRSSMFYTINSRNFMVRNLQKFAMKWKFFDKMYFVHCFYKNTKTYACLD